MPNNIFKRFARFVRGNAARRQEARGAPVAQPQPPQQPAQDLPGDAPEGLSLAALPTDEDLERHCKAYKAARYFHVTRLENVKGILQTGLDPSKGGSPTGATVTANEQRLLESVQGKVHVGEDRSTALYYERVLRKHEPERLRVFVEPAQKAELHEDFQDDTNLAFWTTQHLQANQIVSGRFSNQDVNTLRTIFTTVLLHYPDVPPRPPVDTVIQWHFVAMKRGMLSYEIGRGHTQRHNSF